MFTKKRNWLSFVAGIALMFVVGHVSAAVPDCTWQTGYPTIDASGVTGVATGDDGLYGYIFRIVVNDGTCASEVTAMGVTDPYHYNFEPLPTPYSALFLFQEDAVTCSVGGSATPQYANVTTCNFAASGETIEEIVYEVMPLNPEDPALLMDAFLYGFGAVGMFHIFGWACGAVLRAIGIQ